MNCGQFRQFYSDFTDGLLDEAEEVAFHVHMAECLACKRFDAALTHGRAALRRIESPFPSKSFEARLQERIRQECAEDRQPPTLRQLSGIAGAVMVVAVVGVAGWRAWGSWHPAQPAALRGPGQASAASFAPLFSGDTTVRYVGHFHLIPVSRDTDRSLSRASRGMEITVDWMP